MVSTLKMCINMSTAGSIFQRLTESFITLANRTGETQVLKKMV